MPDRDPLDERLRAVERALADTDVDLTALADAAALAARVEDAEEHLADLDRRVAELEAATQALRGYVGEVRHVNEAVEGRADAALARVERLEAELDDRPPPARRRRDRTPPGDATGALAADAGDASVDATDDDSDDDGATGLLAAVGRWL